MVQTEKVREQFAQRLALACKNFGLSEHGRGMALARALGVSSKGVSKWFNAEALPRQAMLEAIAKYLRVDPVWLQHGINQCEEPNVSYEGAMSRRVNRYPLISFISAGNWLDATEPYNKEDISEWPETTVDSDENSFWLKVKGDSMTSPSGLSVPEGMIILVDPTKEATNGKLVVAKLEPDNEATFKMLVIDAGRRFLKPLNPQYPLIPINGNCTIIGVVVDAKLSDIP